MTEQKKFYVYLHVKPNGEPFYVGKGIRNRASLSIYRNAHHYNVRMKYGTANIRIIKQFCESEEAAFELEKLTIKALREKYPGKLSNMTDGGDGVSGYKHDLVDVKRRADMLRGKPGRQKGYKHTQEAILKIIEAGHRRPVKLETRQKLAAANTGKRHTEESKQKNREWHLGRKQSEVTKEKRATKHRGRKNSEATKLLMSKKAKLREERKRLEREQVLQAAA